MRGKMTQREEEGGRNCVAQRWRKREEDERTKALKKGDTSVVVSWNRAHIPHCKII